MFENLSDGNAYICIASLVLGVLCSKVRSGVARFTTVLLAPILMSYILAKINESVELSRLHQSHVEQGGWDLVAAMYWSMWAIPSAIVGYIAGRWLWRTKGDSKNAR